MSVFDYAIRMYEQGAEVFERLFHDTTDPDLERIFGLLAAREREYILELAAMKQTVNPEDADSVMVDRAWHVKSGYEKLLENGDIMHELRTDADGYEHIVKAEEENIRMLEGMAAAEPHGAARILMHQMAESKRRQLEEIENIYDFVETPRTFLEWGEFSNLHPL
jgi:rubrerythrin